MKKVLILTVVLGCVSLSVSAQGLYFDVGGGAGKAWTKTDGVDQFKMWRSAIAENLTFVTTDGKKADIDDVFGELSFNLGARAGYGPFGTLPLFFVVEFDWVGHSIYIHDVENLEFDALYSSFLIGPGVIYYPWPVLQVGASVGYSFVSNSLKPMPEGARMLESEGGFAGNVSVAINLGGKHALLIGAKYSFSVNTLEKNDLGKKPVQTISAIGFFMKYAFRPKVTSWL